MMQIIRYFPRILIHNKIVSQQLRNTWVLRRVIAPEPTPEGQHQRNPCELPNLMKYEVVDKDDHHPCEPVKVILLEDVEGIGHQFDVVDVVAKVARTDLLLSRKAVYASPFDLKYYGEMKERMKDELARKVRIPYDYIVVGRKLMKLIIPLRVSMEVPWKLDRKIVHSSLIQSGLDTNEESIFLDKSPISGPNLEIEARLLRFYTVIDKQYVVPMLARIMHISSDETKQVLYPESSKLPEPKELSKYGLKLEEPYFHNSPVIEEDFDVFGLMKTRELR